MDPPPCDCDCDCECPCITKCGKCLCQCSFNISIIATIILVINFTIKAPRFYLSQLHLPTSPGNLTYNLQIRNMAKLVGVRYDDLVFSVHDGGNLTFNASATIPGFYQGHRKTKKVDGELEGGWTATAERNGTSSSTSTSVSMSAKLLVVRVDGSFRYRAGKLWKSKRHGVKVGGNFVVNSTVGDAVAGDERIQLLNVHDPPPPPPSGAVSSLRWCGGGAAALIILMAATLHLLIVI